MNVKQGVDSSSSSNIYIHPYPNTLIPIPNTQYPYPSYPESSQPPRQPLLPLSDHMTTETLPTHLQASHSHPPFHSPRLTSRLTSPPHTKILISVTTFPSSFFLLVIYIKGSCISENDF